MLQTLKKALSIVIPLGLLLIAVNDAGRYFGACYNLDNATREAASASSENAHSTKDRTLSWQAGDVVAQRAGVTIYGYDMTSERVTIWTKMPVSDTFILARASALMSRKPMSTPMFVDSEGSAIIQ